MSKASPAMPATLTSSAGSSDSNVRWTVLFGCPAPQRLPSLIEQAVAWREQAMQHGDVSLAVVHDLKLAAEHALARRGVGQKDGATANSDAISLAPALIDDADVSIATATPDTAASSRKAAPSSRNRTTARTAAALPPAASQLLPGSQLIKAHGGRNHIVAVEEGGFRYEGAVFSSLSAIAKHITGTHWNGLLFFGLRKRRSYPPKPRRHD
ncbi:DUF2924 domain-containing protein [Sphingomonas sp. CV7422]|uniref:DUF2924 domain-containing protein n=1 Tax=Sphingomonas sp. CV7422 TaxID=3018036 RepID=UPI0022FDD805|nr:DUF2924 domain-containing protein [Sphingomonas sp. CV7422]